MNDFYAPGGIDEFSGASWDILSQPLVNQPGEVWEYGVNVDWAGVLVERVSGLSLNDYFLKYILGPMGLKHINMFPTKEMKQNLAYMHVRMPDGKLVPNPNGHLARRQLWVESPHDIKDTFNSGGAGCFATPADYCQIIATLMNDGTHPGTGARILQKKTVDDMFTNQVS